MQDSPAGLSSVLIEGAIQQAPQPGRQFMVAVSPAPTLRDSLNKSVTPAKAGVQMSESTGFRLSPE